MSFIVGYVVFMGALGVVLLGYMAEKDADIKERQVEYALFMAVLGWVVIPVAILMTIGQALAKSGNNKKKKE